jgi:hypothetical protein
VVVGERNSSVSDRMQDSIAPFTQSGILRGVVAHQVVHDRRGAGQRAIVMSIGPLVSIPPTSLWWSMIAWMSAALMFVGQFGGVVGVDDDDGLVRVHIVDDPRLGQVPAFPA